MTLSLSFTLDDQTVSATPGETIWQVANRLGKTLPHLCHRPQPGYRPDGNCRACVVEIKGERALAASCRRPVSDGMTVVTNSERVNAAQRMVFELLLADQPPREQAPDPEAPLWQWHERLKLGPSRFSRVTPEVGRDVSNPAIAVHLEACIHCGLCQRACREVQVNDVIGLAGRGGHTRVVFDQGDAMGDSTCVSCGECVAACPTGALLPKSVLDDQGRRTKHGEKSVPSLCPYCGVGCQLTYHVRDNRLLAVSGRNGPANQGRLCVKGRYGFDYIHHPHRLSKPLIRKSDARKSADCSVDPADPSSHFREASWDEALDYAAAGLRRILEQRGGKALAGFGSAKGSNEEAYLFQKLIRTGFGVNNVDHCTRLCHASSVAALMETIGSGAVTAPFAECAHADVIMVIGANPTLNHPVAATFIKNAVKRGAKLIVLDPRGQALARHAHQMVRFTNGRDVAVLNALMHVIVTENLFDAAYIEARTEGFDTLRQHLQAFSPEAMSDICGVDPETLRRVARTYAQAKAALIFWGMGVSQHIHGTDNARCLIALALMCGHVGRPGTGLHPLRGQNNVQGASDAGLIPMVYPDYQPVANASNRARFEDFWQASLDPEPGLTVVEIMDAACRGEITGMYIMGENPAMSDPNLNHARQGLATLEHLIVQDLFLTETAWHADVVLPASAFPEKTGTFTNTDRRVQMGRQALEPPADARQDLWIIQELARRLGLPWNYDGPAAVFDEMRQCLTGFAGISWSRLEAEDAVTYPCSAADEPGQEILFGERFPTSTGRGKFVPADLILPDETPDQDYPMVLSTGRLLEHWHTGSMTRRAPVLDNLEPEAIALISPLDLSRQDISAGQSVRIETRRGTITVTARADPDITPGTLFIPFCFSEGAANLLTNQALDPFGKIAELKYCAARISKAEP